MSNPRFTFIVNPQAGRGEGRRQLPRLQKLLEQTNLDWQILPTEAPEHATALAKRIGGEHQVVVAVGGDGTTHEVAAGLIDSDSILSVLPIGSGNDFARLLGFSKSLEGNFEKLLAGRNFFIDIGEYVARTSVGEVKRGIFVNSLGIGVDASISYNSRQIKRLRGIPLYLVATFKTLLQFKPISISYDFGRGRHSKKVFLVCIGNGPHEGGGFKLTPGARPDDGTFEVCLIEAMPLISAMRLIPRVLAGSHNGFKGVNVSEANSISVDSEETFYIHCDGEIPTASAVEVRVSLRPKALQVRAASGKLFTNEPQVLR
jgi:YegS/Rv2252/BmrU family lipid kinase